MKLRLLSSIVMLLLVIPIVIQGNEIFAFFTLILGLLSLKELIDIKQKTKQIPLIVKLLAYIAITILITGQFSSNILVYSIDYRLFSLVLFTMIVPVILYHDYDRYNIDDSMFLIGSIFFLGITFSMFVLIRDYSLMYLLFILIISTITDSYAYITGTLIGRNKLLEVVSPKKTIEGTIFGVIFGTIFGTMFYYMAINNAINIFVLIAAVLLLSIVSQLGDMCFSAIKRKYKTKDFSNLIPGHGGILDRLDSIIFIVLIFSLIINII